MNLETVVVGLVLTFLLFTALGRKILGWSVLALACGITATYLYYRFDPDEIAARAVAEAHEKAAALEYEAKIEAETARKKSWKELMCRTGPPLVPPPDC